MADTSVATPEAGYRKVSRSPRSGPIIDCDIHNYLPASATIREYDIASGQSRFDPARTRVRPYQVTVESGASLSTGGDGRFPGPCVDETLEVTVDSDYVVVIP